MRARPPALILGGMAAMLCAGCMVVPQTYEPKLLADGRLPAITGFIPDDYRGGAFGISHPPTVHVNVEDLGGTLDVSLCTYGWDVRRVHVLTDQSSLTDAQGRRYRLTFQPNDFANNSAERSMWVSYDVRAFGPLPSSGRQRFYGRPHTLRVVYTEDGRRYTAEREFAATYPLITPFDWFRALRDNE